MRRFRAKGHERARLCDHVKTGRMNTRENERAATINAWSGCFGFSAQEYNRRDQSTFSFQSQQSGVPILMSYEEVTFTITEKLWILAFIETDDEMFFDSFFAG